MPNTPDLPILRTMGGVIEPLTDFVDFRHKESTEGEKSISFFIYKTERNDPIFDLIKNKEKIEFEGNKYVIDICDRQPIGITIEKYVEARHEMFDRLNGTFIEEQYSGYLRIERALEIALEGSGLTFEVIGNFSSLEFENFGRDKGLKLFKQVINRWGVEYRVEGTHLIIAQEIGNVTDAQFRHAHNLKTISEHIDSTDVATFIKGFSYDEETGELLAYAEYESPYSHLYRDENGNKRLIHAEYVYDNRFRNNDELREYIKTKLKDTPDYNIKITYEELKKNGFNLHHYQLGDYVWCIYEPMDLDLQVRIISIESYPYDPHRSPIIELGNFRRDVTKELASIKNKANEVEGTATQAQVLASQARQRADEVKQQLSSTGTTLAQHLNDYVRHITDEERARWNAGVTSGDVTDIVRQYAPTKEEFNDHVSDKVAHWTQEQRDALEQRLQEIENRLSALECGDAG